jgi:hypothetical protein
LQEADFGQDEFVALEAAYQTMGKKMPHNVKLATK